MHTYWLVDADESLKRRNFDNEETKCHNSRIEKPFSMNMLRNSPSLRHRILGSTTGGTPRSTPRESPHNSPSILLKNSFHRKRKIDKHLAKSVITSEKVKLLELSPRGVSFSLENGDVEGHPV